MPIKLLERTLKPDAAQPAGDERDAARADGRPAGTSGAAGGTSGARFSVPWRAWTAMALFVLAANAVNVLSALYEAGPRLDPWEPVTWELSSAATLIPLLPVIAWLARVAPFERGRLARFLAVQALGTVGFSLVHVGGFVAIRKLVYISFGHHYDFGGFQDFIYEYRKDVLSYGLALAVFSLTARIGAGRPQPERAQAGAAATFDIRDGSRVVRAPVAEILSARSAGNYVEFHLADGRRPLMRATLSGVEAALAGHGFVRTHRSWLVNPGRVRALEPEGSGDWRVELEGGGLAPVSRRFPQALEALRRPG